MHKLAVYARKNDLRIFLQSLIIIGGPKIFRGADQSRQIVIRPSFKHADS